MSNYEGVAVVGFAARLPGARSASSFWSLLQERRCSIGRISADRFSIDGFYHPSSEQRGRSYTFAAGLIDDVWGFDAAAFGMSPREAEQVDPQQRQLLEITSDALAHAGIRASSLAGQRTGVFIGASSLDYGARFFSDPSAADVHMMTGNTLSILSNRISYFLNAKGPSFTVDTACSSSLVALSLAVDAIRNGSVDTAIVGGVNLLLSPFSFIGFSRASMLSPTGLCRPFDAGADGYVRAEGAIVLVLRSMAAARSNSNRVYATILGAAVGQDGRTTGLSLPSSQSQQELLERVYQDAGVDPADLAFVEAHGTGTRVGDPIEANALGKALGQRRSQPLPIGSVKSNIGHLEPASGLAGVLKSILALNERTLPATLHQSSPSADIPFDELNLRVVDRNWRLPEVRGPALAGVNSFGFGGTNAHVILQAGETNVRALYSNISSPPSPLFLSAHSKEALRDVANVHLHEWPSDPKHAADFIAAAAHLRDPLPYRAIILGSENDEIRLKLHDFAQAKSSSIIQSQALGNELPVTFLFSGNGSQWSGMGRTAWHTNLQFREALQELGEKFVRRDFASPEDLLFADDLAVKLRRATVAQPLLLAVQVATVRALEANGLLPTATLGHSVGEISAAWAAGALSLDQAIDVVIARSRNLEIVRGRGAMAALMLSERDARRLLTVNKLDNVDIAAINSWRSVTVSGSIEQINELVRVAGEARVGARRLDLDYPYHSGIVDPVRGPLLRELQGLTSATPRKRFVSSTTGVAVDQEILGAEHWWHNMRDPVRFDAALNSLIADGMQLFVEVGPKPILLSYVRDSLRDANARGIGIETLTESDAEGEDPIERCVARVFASGGQVDIERLFGAPPPLSLPLPAYPWRHSQYKITPTAEASTIFVPPAHPLIGKRLRQDSFEWYSSVDTDLFPWLRDHAVEGVAVFPAAGYVEAALAAAAETYEDPAVEVRELDIIRPLIFDNSASFETLIRLNRETGLLEILSRQRSVEADWGLNARAIIARCPAVLRQCATDSGPVIIPKAKVYEASKELGFDYGPAFQRVSRVSFPEAKRAVAVLEEGSALAGAQQVSDLTALDAAFHALFASEEAGVADMPMKRMLPVRFGRVRAYKRGAIAHQAIARTVRQSPSSMVTNIELVDAESNIVLSAEMVRLVEAPVAAELDANTLTYRTDSWELSRPLVPSGLAPCLSRRPEPEMAGEALSEALLLLEAGCLRATWAAFRNDRAARVSPEQLEEQTDWPAYLASSQLWHLETKNLVKEQDGELALVEACDLPAVPSVVRSLLMRHPTMAGEAAGLSRLSEMMERLVTGEISAKDELSSPHWRQLDVISEQTSVLRSAIEEELAFILQRRPRGQFVRLLLIGAHHSAIIAQRLDQTAGVEVLVTDFDTGRLEQVSAALGDEAGFTRCVAWSELDGLPSGSVDLIGAVDSLSEIAASADGLSRLKRLLRPRASLIAGEPAPSLFWDLIRGIRPSWWARSTNSDFPVGALLTGREWVDELRTAGFSSVSAEPALGEEGIGVILYAIADTYQVALDAPAHGALWGWAGQETATSKAVREVVQHRTHAFKAEESPSPEVVRGVIWTIEARRVSDVAGFTTVLAQLAECAQVQASASAPFSVLVDLGNWDHSNGCLANPVWTAVTAALRVAQNEYPSIAIRCIGVAGQPGATPFLESVAEEIVSPSDEREVCFVDGKRTVFRLARGVAMPTPRSELPSDRAVQLVPRSSSTRGALVWTAHSRRKVEAGEVEIEVKATGLNFRDVMWNLGLLPEEALEDGYAGASLGMECAGVVTAVGPGETELSPGDRVVAFVSGGFTSHVIAPTFALRRIPSAMSFEAAATIPVAFLTAYYSLVHLAELKRGETVLVHGGAGAVGLAALQVAQLVGATVVATAGTDEKRSLLRDLGAQHVLNSRTLAFADEVMAHTQGKGVDVVLNSLAGEAMVRSMDCLRPFGRFIELGKRDFYANTHIGLRPFRRNLTYHGVDVDQLLTDHRELTGQLFGEVLQRFETGQFVPLPHRVFAGDQITEAFRFMQRSGHIGKIVVRPANRPTDTRSQSAKFPVSVDGWHVIVGGTSGFGFATAQWLADRGARYLVLASRSGTVAEELSEKIAELRRAGVTVDVAALDVSDYTDCEALMAELQRVRPIKGVVHAAMVLEDRLIQNLDEEAIENVLTPKVGGALNLEMLSGKMKLDYLLLFSSATTLLGNPGQFNYVAANAYLEGLATKAQQAGIPALAVAWGAIEDTGYLARNIQNNMSLRKRFASSLVSARQALNGLDLAFDANGKPAVSALSIAQIDWSMAKRELAVSRTPFFGAVVSGTGSRQSIDAAATLEKLKGLSIEDAATVLLDMIVDEIARVLRLPPKEVDRHRPLAEIGMDSLMMLELRATVETTLQVDLPMMSLANGITPSDIARRVAGLLLGADQQEKVSGRLMALSGSHLGTEVEQLDSRQHLAAAKAVLEQSNKLQGSL
jgi:acyl transferase domain-containing protein/NADPH:quinone reductase-like Zn-dependent oxidoreductase/acyl carrier protein